MKKILLILFLFLICFNVKALDIDSRNAVLINLNTDKVIYEKGKDDRVSIASLQKILTSIVAIEHIDNLNEKIIINKSKISDIGSDVYTIGIKDQEELTYYDLLEMTLLKSAGDAAKYLALSVSSSEEDFANLVNDKVKELGLENTVYKDPIGLERDGQYSTAYDIAKVLEYALKNDSFKEIFTTSNYKTTDEQFEFIGPRTFANERESSYIIGAKTGYTKEAGDCLASYIKNNKEEFILVTLHASVSRKTGNFDDQKTIMDYYLNNYKLKKILKKNQTLTTVTSTFKEEININNDEDIYYYVKNDSKIIYKYKGLEKVNTKHKNGDYLGKYYVYENENIIYEKDIYLNKDIGFYIPVKIRYILGGVSLSLIVIIFITKLLKKNNINAKINLE